MALEIRNIPVLTGSTAESFVRAAEEREKNPRHLGLKVSFAQIDEMTARARSYRELLLKDSLVAGAIRRVRYPAGVLRRAILPAFELGSRFGNRQESHPVPAKEIAPVRPRRQLHAVKQHTPLPH